MVRVDLENRLQNKNKNKKARAASTREARSKTQAHKPFRKVQSKETQSEEAPVNPVIDGRMEGRACIHVKARFCRNPAEQEKRE